MKLEDKPPMDCIIPILEKRLGYKIPYHLFIKRDDKFLKVYLKKVLVGLSPNIVFTVLRSDTLQYESYLKQDLYVSEGVRLGD